MTDRGEPPAKRAKTESDGRDTAHFTEHFTHPEVDNLRIRQIKALAHPQLIMEEYPGTISCVETVCASRLEAARCISGASDKLIVVVGPCSIHDPKSALEYAKRLKCEASRFKDDLLIMMRVYFEKPRTTIGWKGLLNDPYLDESFRVNDGLRMGRKLLRDINDMGLPCACEFLDVMTPQYLSDLVSWAAIGSRTTESQPHRELASGLSMPVGFNNGTSGDVDVAIDAVIAAKHPHCFFSISKHGTAAAVHSGGNDSTHVVLCGGKTGPNFDQKSVAECLGKLGKAGLQQGVMVDCASANCQKNHQNQPKVAKTIAEQIKKGAKICGIMIKSHMFEGRQDLPDTAALRAAGVSSLARPGDALDRMVSESPVIKAGLLRYGMSVTDGCVDWTTTVDMLEPLAMAVRERRKLKAPTK